MAEVHQSNSVEVTSVDIPAFIQEIFQPIQSDSGSAQYPWVGRVNWRKDAPVKEIGQAIGQIAALLFAKGYNIIPLIDIKTSSANFKIGMRDESSPDAVPKPVKNDWNLAVSTVARTNPNLALQNEGISDASQ